MKQKLPRYIFEHFGTWSRSMHVLAIFLGLLLISVLDWQTGVEIQFFIFYAFPVAHATWYLGRREGLGIGLVALGLLGFNNHYWNTLPSSNLVTFWNLGMRLIFFTMLTMGLSALRQSYASLQTWAETDTLTGLANRRIFFEHFELATERCRRNQQALTLVYIDLDHFKQVNDQFGHHTGDQLLQIVAQTLVKVLRKTDLIARLGGDEFVLVLENTPAEQAQIAIERLQKQLLEAMQARQWPVTFSLGMVSFKEILEVPQEMLQKADQLMYKVKKTGRNHLLSAVYPENTV